MNEVAAFLARRPHYEHSHVFDLSVMAAAEGLPFCGQCADWHAPSAPHTED